KLVFGSDSSRVAVGFSDGPIEVWHIQQEKRLASLSGHQGSIQDLCITRDNTSVLSASTDGRVILWNLATKLGVVLGGRMNSYNCVADSIDGRRAAAGADDGTIRIWDLESRQEVAILRGHAEWVR